MSEIKIIKASTSRINRNSTKIVERIRVAAYCRVSTDSEEQLNSYNSQVIHYKTFVESDPEWEFVDIYADEGILSGSLSANEGVHRCRALEYLWQLHRCHGCEYLIP